MKKAAILISVLFLSSKCLLAQPGPLKKDTLYYLVDTAKTPKLDRIISIGDDKVFKYYYFNCPCFPGTMQPNLTFYYDLIRRLPGNDSIFPEPVFIKKGTLKQIPFTSLRKLIQTACKEQRQFKFHYVLFFIEHLPNGKYTKMKVRLQEPAIKDD